MRATPVVFLPSDLPGGEALLGWATDVLLLTDPAQVRHQALARGIGERLRRILIPPGEPAPAEVAEPALPALLTEPAPLAEPEVVEPVEALPMFDLDAYVSAEVEPDEEQLVEPLPTLDIEVPADKEELEQAAAFNLSGFDGMLEKPDVQASQPVVLEPEEEPVVTPGALGGDTLLPPPPEPGGFGLSNAVPPAAAAPAPPPPRTRVPAASDLSRAAPRSAAARLATRPTPRPAQPTKSRVGLLLALLVASILLLVGVTWFGYIEVPWLSPWLAGLRGQPVSVAPVPHGPSRVDILAFVLELPAPDAPIERTGHHLA